MSRIYYIIVTQKCQEAYKKKVRILSSPTSNFKNQILDIGHIKCKNLHLHCPTSNVIIIKFGGDHMQNIPESTHSGTWNVGENTRFEKAMKRANKWGGFLRPIKSHIWDMPLPIHLYDKRSPRHNLHQIFFSLHIPSDFQLFLTCASQTFSNLLHSGPLLF